MPLRLTAAVTSFLLPQWNMRCGFPPLAFSGHHIPGSTPAHLMVVVVEGGELHKDGQLEHGLLYVGEQGVGRAVRGVAVGGRALQVDHVKNSIGYWFLSKKILTIPSSFVVRIPEVSDANYLIWLF